MKSADVDMDQFKTALVKVVEGYDDLSFISERTKFIEDLGMNSITLIALVFICEEKFCINMTEYSEEITKLTTVGKAINFINQLKKSS